MKYTIKEHVFLVKNFYKYSDMKSKLRAWRAEYPKQLTPNHSTVKNIVSDLEKYGSVAHDLKVNIEKEVRKIPCEMLKSSFLNLKKRCDLIKSVDGGQIE